MDQHGRLGLHVTLREFGPTCAHRGQLIPINFGKSYIDSLFASTFCMMIGGELTLVIFVPGFATGVRMQVNIYQ